jgi:hyperosmotically inducible periplasmic protein
MACEEEGCVKKLFSSAAIVTLLAAAPLTVACNRPSTPNYEERVQDNLKSAKIDDVKANWKADEKALHLSGEAESAADKARAEELAQQVVGTSGRVVNEVKVKGTNAEAMDDRIEQDLDRAFKEDDEWDRDTLDLTFDSKAGVVTITGSAPSEAIKEKITARVKTIDGVKDVVNNLEIKPGKADTKRPNKK